MLKMPISFEAGQFWQALFITFKKTISLNQKFVAERVYNPKASVLLNSIPHTGASDTLFEDTERASSSFYIPKVCFVKWRYGLRRIYRLHSRPLAESGT